MAKKRLTDAERLAAHCLKCGAVPGEMCRDKNVVRPGDVARFCLERAKPEVTRKKLQKRADYLNAKAGPDAQFPGLLGLTPEAEEFRKEFRPVTVGVLLEQYRRGAAFEPENDWLVCSPLNKPMEWLRVCAMEALAVRLFGEEVARPAIAYARRTYPMPDYGANVWAGWLCEGKQTAIVVHAEPDPRPGMPNQIRLVHDVMFPPDPTPRITREEFDRRFKIDHHRGLRDAPEPDDGGLFERTIGALRRAA